MRMLVMASLLGASVAGAAPDPVVARLRDGAELVVVEIPGAETLSFRYLVHSGGNADPSPGLAHLLEHLIFHGTYRFGERDLFRAVRARGGSINGYTTTDSTGYVIDAPRGDADAVVAMMIEALTNPVVAPRHIEVERMVVRAESELRPSRGLYGVMTELLSPAFRNEGAVIGTQRSRNVIGRDDLVAFYNQHYRPSNTTIVMVGDISPSRARALVESASRAAPEEVAARKPIPPDSFSTPIEAQALAPMYLTLLGYDLSGAPRSACDGLAQLLDLRSNVGMVIERSIADRVTASCLSIGGHQILVTVAWSNDYAGAQIRDELQRAYREARTVGMTSAERRHLEHRSRISLARMRASPPELADALAEALSGDRPGADRTEAVRTVLQPAPLDAVSMTRTAAKFFDDSRQVLINAAPF